MDHLASNIKILREEARLSREEFAEKAGVSVDTVKAWEDGTLRPYTKELMIICPILRIHEDDILERDIMAERTSAVKKMRGNKENRRALNWYYGDKKKMLFYLIVFFGLPLVFLITYFFVTTFGGYEEQIKYLVDKGIEVPLNLQYYYIFYPALATGFVNMIIVVIWSIIKFQISIKWWYVILAISFLFLLEIIGTILILPTMGYAFYKGIIKHGKN